MDIIVVVAAVFSWLRLIQGVMRVWLVNTMAMAGAAVQAIGLIDNVSVRVSAATTERYES